MKSLDALSALGLHDRVAELFLQGNQASVSSFVRGLLMQAKFYNISADRLANFLSKEVLWQESVYQEYSKVICHSRLAVEQKIESDSAALF